MGVEAGDSPKPVFILGTQILDTGFLGWGEDLEMGHFVDFFKEDSVNVDSFDEEKFLVLGVGGLDDVLVGDRIGKVQQDVENVADGSTADGDSDSQHIDVGGVDQVVACLEDFVCGFGDEVGLENQVERDVDCEGGSCCHHCHLPELEPFQNASVFIEDLSGFEVELVAGFGSWHFYERLVEIGWVENILFESE